MTREQYQTIHVTNLRELAKSRGIKRTSVMKKSELIDAMLALDAEHAAGGTEHVVNPASTDMSGEGADAENGAFRNGRRKQTPVAETTPFSVKSPVPTDGTGSAETDAAEGEAAAETQNAAVPVRTDEASAAAERPAPNTSGRGRRGRPAGRSETRHEPVRDASETESARQSTVRRTRAGRPRRTETSGDDKHGDSPARRPRQAGETPRAGRPRRFEETRHAAAEHPSGSRVSGRAVQGSDYASSPEHPQTVSARPRRGGDAQSEPGQEEKPFSRRPAPEERKASVVPAGGAQRPAEAVSVQEPGQSREERDNGEASAAIRHREEADHRCRGILEVMQDGFGFLRSDNFLPGEEDVYVSPSQIRRFNLKTGDMIEGTKRERGQGEKYGALLYVSTVNDFPADEARHRAVFENMTPIFPNERIRLERPDGSRATRIVDLFSPIGKGQRGMIVSPPKAGKTTLLKDIARSILTRNPDANLIILLIDERPEEVTDMKESVHGKNVEIIYSTFDELPEHHRRVSEMVIERAKRLVEHHEDVVILLDSITRLTRACNVLVPQSGRTLSGGLDPTALYMPKRFFGAARNMREGGSLTILATALVDTGSKMDDVVYEEFKGTGNMELILDRKLQERRIFPAIDIVKSGTRREDLLLTPRELKAVDLMRRRINGLKAEEAVESVINAFTHYSTNEQVVAAVLQKWGP